ncbi:hypothetical protein [Rubinisphaera brasiliensis]|uniref:Nif11 domain-containing protein n=1 Tax=Rubinisphaera brasiliensis (strain ATCC 49424 / DSM 5305 / JCM 21570 / IAM 15109 / NBRC 103401 / IFAM 1448) TaxID=756272 RepID=F0SR44_RUBBR|nr:hypothetical protein [Rubinisphaera brasiliensis]ADY61291.1 hypothetical protein Plabr_3698 [Rubinisphaera brasiliensis DSM 5305]
MSAFMQELVEGDVACLERAEDRDSFTTLLMESARERGVDVAVEDIDAMIDEAFNPGSTLTDRELEVVASGCTCAFCTCSYMVAAM